MGVVSEWDKMADTELLGTAQANAKDYTDTQVSSLSGVMDEINAKIDEVKAITEQAKNAATNAIAAANNAKASADAAKSAAQSAANNTGKIDKIAGSMLTEGKRLKVTKRLEKNETVTVVNMQNILFDTFSDQYSNFVNITISYESQFMLEVIINGVTIHSGMVSEKTISIPTKIKINNLVIKATGNSSNYGANVGASIREYEYYIEYN